VQIIYRIVSAAGASAILRLLACSDDFFVMQGTHSLSINFAQLRNCSFLADNSANVIGRIIFRYFFIFLWSFILFIL